MLSIFTFTDYRLFLKSYYQKKKNLDPQFSYGVLAQKVKISSRGLLKLIMDGKRNLSFNNISGITNGLELNKSESEYFMVMVQFNQTKVIEEKNKHYQKILSFPQRRKLHHLAREQYNLYSKWYYCLLYELILLKKENQSLEEFCQKLTPILKNKLTLKEIREGYQELISLGLLKVESDKVLQSNNFIESNAKEELSFAIQNFHKEMMTQALTALDQPLAQREFGGVTLAVRKIEILRAKEFIREFRNKFNLEFSVFQGAESVYQLNIQFFELADGSSLHANPNSDLNSANDLQIIEAGVMMKDLEIV